MKFDLEWLLEHVDGSRSADALADRLTACGFLVELREREGGVEVWDVEVTTNRPDAMNHRGLAREAVVAIDGRLRPLEYDLEESDEAAADLASVKIADPDLCSRYVARVIRNVTVTESPQWLKERVERVGVRSVNAVVDATNHVLLELGQPLHAFDLHRLGGRKVIVRRATNGETLTTLDGEPRSLDSSMLVIADDQRPVALAGIMGGADSEIQADTCDVLLESAHFDPLTIRRAARRFGLHTEASHRFERGCDPEMAATACDVAAALIARLTGGHVCRGRIDARPRPWAAAEVSFSVPALSAFTGMEVEAATVERILGGLEFSPVRDGENVTCTVPPFRIDVEREADLYEEVIRHVGYDAVPSRLPALEILPGHRHSNWDLVDLGRRAAVATGLTEVINFAFVNPSDDAITETMPLCPGPPVILENPLAQTQGSMRRSLLTGLLSAARENFNQGERLLSLFEQGRVFWKAGDGEGESERLALVLAGGSPLNQARRVGFADLKGVVEMVLDRASFPAVTWRRGGGPWLDAGEGAELTMDGGRLIGVAGRLSAEVAARWDLKQAVYVAELDLGVAVVDPPPVQFQSLPRFPSVAADMTVEHSPVLTYAELEAAVIELADERVEGVELLDRFTGKGLAEDRVRTTLRLVYRHPERSLTQDEVNALQEALRQILVDRLQIRFA